MEVIDMSHVIFKYICNREISAFKLIWILFFCFLPEILICQVTHKINFSISEASFSTIEGEDNTQYDRISFVNARTIMDTGKPELPIRYIKLIVSPLQKVENILITNVNSEEISGSYLIYPVQRSIPLMENVPKPVFTRPDTMIYSSTNIYPAEVVKTVHDGYFDGDQHIITIAVYPFQYRPKLRKLIFNSSVDFTLKMTSGKSNCISVRMRNEKYQNIYDAILYNLVDNPEMVETYKRKPKSIKGNEINSINTLPIYEYVIITNNNLKNNFNSFVSWKKRKGINIGVVTTESIYAEYIGDEISGIYDDAGKIRQYLSDAYQSGTVWVLLAGDHTIVPVRYGTPTDNYPFEEGYMPTDLYFSDFTGDWKIDGDALYGEPGNDYVDYNPEIFIGRLPCSSAQDIINWTHKVLTYEMNPGNGDYSYVRNNFWIWGPDTGPDPDNYKGCYPFTRHTVWDQDPAHKGSEVITEMSNHYGFIHLYCHGGPTRFSVKGNPNGRIWTGDDYCATGYCSDEAGDGLDNMTNINYPAIVYSICCGVAGFDDYQQGGESWPGRSIVEGWTVCDDLIGGPNFLGNTRLGLHWISADLECQFGYLLALGTQDPESGESYFHVGVAEGVSKQNFDVHELRLGHNNFGCPETQIWTYSPVTFSNVVITDNGNSLTVDPNVYGCDICVCSGDNGNSYYLATHNVANYYTFTTSVRPLYITITKHNYIPYTAVTGGTFSSHETWFGDLQVRGNVTISSGKNLNILPGTKIKFLDDTAKLTMNGRLIAEGNSLQPIIFTSANQTPDAGDWYGIDLKSGQNSIKYCNIQYATYGIIVHSTSGTTIENCNITNCSNYGIDVENANQSGALRIKGSNIASNTVGLGLHNGWASLESSAEGNTVIQNNYRQGIYSLAGYLLMNHATIQSNGGLYSEEGMLIDNGSQIYFSPNGIAPGWNTVKDNTGVQIWGMSGSTVNIGKRTRSCICEETLSKNIPRVPSSIPCDPPCYWRDVDIWGYNSISGNSMWIHNAGNTIYTHLTFWGVNPPCPATSPPPSKFSGNPIHREYPQCIQNFMTNTMSGGGDIDISFSNLIDDIDNDHAELDSITLIGYIKYLKRVLFEEPDSADYVLQTLLPLVGPYGKFTELLEMPWEIFLQQVQEKVSVPEIRERAIMYQIMNRSVLQDYDGVISLVSSTLKNNPSNALWFYCQVQKVAAYLQNNSVVRAEEIYNSISDKGNIVNPIGMKELRRMITLIVDKLNSSSQPPENEDRISSGTSKSLDYKLEPNYPNPFNPATIIKYEIPEGSLVSLKVYDILGRVIRTLVNEYQDAGFKEVSFDAAAIPSGIYFYRLQAGKFTDVKKMLLVR